MTRVVLHIGSFKTGTSFIQSVLKSNRDQLADQGILWPGRSWGDQVKWAASIRSKKPVKPPRARIVIDEINAWDGHTAVISMEFLSLANANAVHYAMNMLRGHEVEVLISARDLGRVFPAQWQESVQHEHTWSYREYINGVIEESDDLRTAHRHFWSRHDWPAILNTWANGQPNKLVILTVPPAGSDRELLWTRFCNAVGIEPGSLDTSARVNDSLGAASAEVMRYAALALGEMGKTGKVSKKRILAKQILVARKSDEPSLILPPEHQGWALRESSRMLDELRGIGPEVVGDLDDLTPRFDVPEGAVTTDPSSLPAEQLLAAAGVGLMGMCAYVDRKSEG